MEELRERFLMLSFFWELNEIHDCAYAYDMSTNDFMLVRLQRLDTADGIHWSR